MNLESNPHDPETPRKVNVPLVADVLTENTPPVGDEPSIQLPAKPQTILNGDPGVDTHPQSVADQKAPSRTLGRYQILGELGRGGMGAVYLAEDTVLKRRVALKIPQFEASKAEQMQARFLREAQMAAKLSHPNICQTYDISEIDGQYVMAMEYIDGKTLNAYTKRGRLLSDRLAVSLVRKVALAVEVAHQQGMIHRDLKPGNIMLPKPASTQKKIEPKVMDFGLAKSLDARTTELTKSGMIVGTPCYMSKEQWSGKEAQLGPQCDVCSLGVILYELLTGHLPYDVEDGEPATSWFVKLVTEPPIRPSERKPDVDAALSDIVMKAIAKDPQDRFASMADFAAALEAWLKGKPVTGHTMLGIQLGALPNLEPKPKPQTQSSGNWRKFFRKPLVMWGGLGGLATLLLGIIIVVINKNGQKTVIDTPDSSTVSVAPDGTVKSQTMQNNVKGEFAGLLDSEWSGTYKAIWTDDMRPERESTALVTAVTTTGFTIQVVVVVAEISESFIWEYQCDLRNDRLQIVDARLIQKTSQFTHGTGRQLIESSQVVLQPGTIEIHLARPTPSGGMQEKYFLHSTQLGDSEAMLGHAVNPRGEESVPEQILIEDVFPLGSTYTGQFGDDPSHIAYSTVTAVEDGIATIRYKNNYAWWDLRFDIVDAKVRLRSVVGVGETGFQGQRVDDVRFFNIRATAPADESARNGEVCIVGTWDISNPRNGETRDLPCRLDFHRND